MSSATNDLMRDLVQPAFDNRMFYARAAEIVPFSAWQHQFRLMSKAKDEFIEKLSSLAAGPRLPTAPRALTLVLQRGYADVLDTLASADRASNAYTAPIADLEDQLLRHFDRVKAEIGSAAVRGALLDQLPKLRACHQQMRGLAAEGDALDEQAAAARHAVPVAT